MSNFEPIHHPALAHDLADLDLPPSLSASLGSLVQGLRCSPQELERGIWVGRDRLAVELDFQGEGLDGDYDPNDPDDIPLLRFCVLGKTLEGEWVELDETSQCTELSADLPWLIRLRAAAHIFEQVEGGLALGSSDELGSETGRKVRRLCESLCWLSDPDFQPLARTIEAERLDQVLPSTRSGPRPRF